MRRVIGSCRPSGTIFFIIWITLVSVTVILLSTPSYADQDYDATISAMTPQPQMQAGVPISLSNLLSVALPSVSAPNGAGPVNLVDAYGTYSNAKLSGLYNGAFTFYNPSWPAELAPDYSNIYLTPQPGQTSVSLSFDYQTAYGNCGGCVGYASYSQASFTFNVGSPSESLSMYVTTQTDDSDRAIYSTASLSATKPSPNSVLVPLPAAVAGAENLDQLAKNLGFASLAWAQVINIPSPSPFYACTDLSCSGTYNVTGSSYDAPESGWDYCNPNSPSYRPEAGGSCLNYPLYPYQDTNDSDTSLSFSDEPSDPCLFGGSGYGCSGETAPSPDILSFTTELVGVEASDPTSLSPLFAIDWYDTFDGTAGGIATTANLMNFDPGTGTGGITIISAGSPLPEPSATVLFALASILVAAISGPHRERTG